MISGVVSPVLHKYVWFPPDVTVLEIRISEIVQVRISVGDVIAIVGAVGI